MCNAYGFNAPISRLIDVFRQLDLPMTWAEGSVPNLPPRDLIRPTDPAPVLRPLAPAAAGEGVVFSEMRWWLVPFFHKGGVKDWKALTTNARSESIDTTATFREPYRRRRCLVPATHFFEWSPLDPARPKGPKTRWRVTAAGEEIFFFAGLWDRARSAGHEGALESFALATCAAGADMAPHHPRQPVILTGRQAVDWLRLDGPGKALLSPSPAGTLHVAAD